MESGYGPAGVTLGFGITARTYSATGELEPRVSGH